MGQRVARLLLYPMACICAMASFVPNSASAQGINPFVFDFTQSPDGARHEYAHVFCGVEGEVNHNCSPFSTPEVADPTPIQQRQLYWYGNMANDFDTRFIQEIVEIDGVEYYHLVIGSEDSGFVQEIYLARTQRVMRDQGGGRFSDSGGVACFASGFIPLDQIEGCIRSNASADPLRHDSTFTGNGTGHPSKMVMRQIVSNDESGFRQEFLKANLLNKPVITQTSSDDNIDMNFVIDMSNSDYDTDSIAGTMTNSFDLKGANLPGEMGDFDLDRVDRFDKLSTNVNAGRYTFRRLLIEDYELENGWRRDIPSSEYTYYDGTIDPVLNVDWAAFRDPSQN